MARLHVVYDPKCIVQVPHGDVSELMKIKVAVIDVPDDSGLIEETVKKLALQLIAQFHNPDV